ncbi:MAG: transporter [Sphingomonadaceae bacterium]|nr:transporter [Sphingomonadaceae bacterium]
MKYHGNGSALALSLMLAVIPAAAQADHSEDHIIAIGQRADERGPAGMMGDHVHRGGEFMVGISYMHDEYGGANQRGTRKISDHMIAMADYTVRVKSMTMDMAMLHLMWAPNDRITFTAMPMWMRMEMTMLGIGDHMEMDGASSMVGHGHHGPMPGETMTHSVSGIGDTEVGALVSLARGPDLTAHAGLAVSIPTGSVSRKNHNGTFVHYGMQPGSGTWDLIPSFTVGGGNEQLRWGAQARYRFSAEDRNKSGFRFGDRFDSSIWLTRPLSPAAAVTARIAYQDRSKVEGHYNGAHGHASPPDRQENYGGKVLQAGLGANLIVDGKWRIGAEAMLPVNQDLNGIQAPKNFGINLNIARMF